MPPTKKAAAKKTPAKPAKKVAKKTPGARARAASSKPAPAARTKVAPLQPVELELRVIPLSKLRAPKKNPRTVVGDVTELAASIRERGVLQSLLVTPGSGGLFEIVAGERRFRAATIVGLPGVPCQIRPAIDAAQALADALIENIQREDMSPIDEAAGMQALIDIHGLEQQQVADRLSVSPAHVSRRLALLKLPEKAVAALNAGEITIADAYELSKLADAPERIDEVLGAGPNERRWALQQELNEHEHVVAMGKARADLEAKGVRVIDAPQSTGNLVVDGAPIRIADAGDEPWAAHIVIDTKAHAAEPCHAVTITGVQKSKPLTMKWCTEKGRHDGAGESALKAIKPKKPTSPAQQKDVAEKARKKAEREATLAREAFMVAKLDGSTSSVLVHELALRRYATSGWPAEAKLMVRLLGLDPISWSRSSTQKDYGGTIRKYLADGDEDTMLRAALARAFAEGEEHGRTNEHRQLLVSLGYQPAEIESEEWAEVETALALTDAESAVIEYEDACKALGVEPDPGLRELADELDTTPPPVTSRARELEQQVRGMHAQLAPPSPLDLESSADALAAPSSDKLELDAAPLGEEFALPLLTDYVEDEPQSGLEAQCRDIIVQCDRNHDEVAELQQELYRGNVAIPRADKMLARLKSLARLHPTSVNA